MCTIRHWQEYYAVRAEIANCNRQLREIEKVGSDKIWATGDTSGQGLSVSQIKTKIEEVKKQLEEKSALIKKGIDLRIGAIVLGILFHIFFIAGVRHMVDLANRYDREGRKCHGSVENIIKKLPSWKSLSSDRIMGGVE